MNSEKIQTDLESNSQSIKSSKYKESIHSKSSKITRTSKSIKTYTKEDMEKYLTSNFPLLKDHRESHPYFCSYEFHQNEEHILSFWNQVLKHIYNFFGVSALKLRTVYDNTVINDRIPIGLENILKEMVSRQLLWTSSLVDNEKSVIYGNRNNTSYFNTIYKVLSYFSSNKPDPNSVDLSSIDSLYIIEKDRFLVDVDLVLTQLKKMAIENDTNTFRVSFIYDNLNIEKENLNLIIKYMSVIRQVVRFIVKINEIDTDCIKIINNEKEDTSINDKDITIINLQNAIVNLDKKINEYDEKVQNCDVQIRQFMLSKNRARAKQVLVLKKIYEKSMNDFFAKRASLEEQVIQIRSMHDAYQVMNILKQCDQVNKDLINNTEEIEEVIDNAKDNTDGYAEINNKFSTYNDNEDNEAIDMELENLQLEISKDIQTNTNNNKNNYEKEANINNTTTNNKLYETAKKNNNYTILDFPSVRKEPSLDELINEFNNKNK